MAESFRDQVREAVERLALNLCPFTVRAQDDSAECVLGVESHVSVRRVRYPTFTEAGVRYQRCGGGRRVLRKSGR